MQSQIINLVIILGTMQASKRIPFEDPTWLNGVRTLYFFSNLIVMSIYLVIGRKIKTKNDQTTLKYVEAAPPMGGEAGKLVTITVSEYDRNQLKSGFKVVLMGAGMMAVLHLYFKFTNPLLAQSILPIKSVLESKLVQVHIFGKPASGDLKRPWKETGLMQMLAGGMNNSDKKVVEEVEKSGRGGAKEE